MIAIFELGSTAFWILLLAAFIVVTMAQEIADSPGSWSTFWVVMTFVILYFCGSKMSVEHFIVYIVQHPLQTVVYFLLYTLAGTLWSFYKWTEVVKEGVEKYIKEVERYKVEYPTRVLNPINYKPKINENKARLFNWIFYWPFSMTWFVIHEPIERLFRFIMEKTKKIYEGIANKAFDKVQIPEKPNENIYNENI